MASARAAAPRLLLPSTSRMIAARRGQPVAGESAWVVDEVISLGVEDVGSRWARGQSPVSGVGAAP